MADPQAAEPGEDATPQSNTEEVEAIDVLADDDIVDITIIKNPSKGQEASEESAKSKPDEQKEPEAAEAKNVSQQAAEEKKDETGGEAAGEEKNGGDEAKTEGKTDGETGEGQDGEKEEEDEQEDKPVPLANRYYTVSYRKIKKGLAKQRISAFEALDFSAVEEESEDGAVTEGAAANQMNGESQNGTSENNDGQNDKKTVGEGQDGEGAVKEAGDAQDEEAGEDMEDEEEVCDGSDGSREKPSGSSKYLTVSYRKIKKGITKQRVDEYEFIGVQP